RPTTRSAMRSAETYLSARCGGSWRRPRRGSSTRSRPRPRGGSTRRATATRPCAATTRPSTRAGSSAGAASAASSLVRRELPARHRLLHVGDLLARAGGEESAVARECHELPALAHHLEGVTARRVVEAGDHLVALARGQDLPESLDHRGLGLVEL